MELEVQALKREIREKLDRIPVRRIVTTSAAVLVVGAVLYYLLGTGKGPVPAAEAAARAIAEDDVDYVRSIAAPGTAGDLTPWAQEAHRRLARQREHWYGKEEAVAVQVLREDRSQGKAVVGIQIHPEAGSARDVSLADPTAATASAAAPFDLETVWTRDWLGRWRLDGRGTVALSRPSH